MECVEEEGPLDRDEADGGSLMTVREQTHGCPLSPCFLHQKQCSNGTNKHETQGRSQTDCVCFCKVSCHKVQMDFVCGNTCICNTRTYLRHLQGMLQDGRNVGELETSKLHYNFPKSRAMQIASKIGRLISEVAG